MAVFLSPGVYVNEVDLSLYVPNLSTTAFGVVGLATKGPINVPTFISDPVQFATTFGDPSVNFMGPYAALQYLHVGRQLWYVRVSEYDPLAPDEYAAKKASTHTTLADPASNIAESSTAASTTGTTNTSLTFTSSNNVLNFSVDEASPGFNVTVATIPIGFSTVQKSVAEVVSTLNADSTFSTYLTASLSLTGTLTITRKVAGADHSFSITGSATTPTNKFGFGSLATPIFGTGIITEKPFVLGNGVIFPVTIATGINDALTFALAGATTVSLTAPLAAGSYTLNTLVSTLNADSNFNADLVANAVAGQLRVGVKSTSAVTNLTLIDEVNDAGETLFGFVNAKTYIIGSPVISVSTPVVITLGVNDKIVLTKADLVGTTPSVNSVITIAAATYTTVAGLIAGFDALPTDVGAAVFTDGGGGEHLKLNLTVGTFTDLILIKPNDTPDPILGFSTSYNTIFAPITSELREGTTVEEILIVNAATEGTWGNNLFVTIPFVDPVAGVFTLNVYEKSILKESYKGLVKTPQTIPDPLNPANQIPNPAYVENAINGISARITVTNPGDSTKLPKASAPGTRYLLKGGLNGETPANSVNPSIYIGVSDGIVKTGLQFFRNPEELDINIIATPGISAAAVINEMIDISQTRGDCMAVVDPPFGLNPQHVVDWRNGAGTYVTDHQAFNSSYAALYWPWLQIFDPVNNVKIFTPPSGHIANVYAFTDFTTDPWRAPAGLTRGHLATPLLAEYNPTLGERDLLYSNNVNPIATFIKDGINVFGQKTLQTKPSALDRVNVRRLMLYMEKVIATAARQLLFEPDDDITWLQFVNLVDPFLQSIKDRRGVVQYEVRCDAITNPPDAVDRNEMNAIILIKPTKAAEFIKIDFVLTAQSTSFNEVVIF